MKYTKSIISFLSLNLLLIFLMIYIANKTREIEKNNSNLRLDISKVTEDIKINKIELTIHNNSSYLRNLYELYFINNKNNNIPEIVTIESLSNNNSNIKLVKANN